MIEYNMIELIELKVDGNVENTTIRSGNSTIITVNRDLYSLFLMHTLNFDWTDQNQVIRGYLLLTLVVFTFVMQLFCLLSLSVAYSTEWLSWVRDEDNWDDIHYFNGLCKEDSCNVWKTDEFMLKFAPVHFINVVCGVYVLFCYILKNVASWFSLYYAYLNYYNDKNDNIEHCSFCCGIFVANLNIALCVATWMFAIFSIFFGFYFEIENPSDILLSSIGAIFILEIDDWIVDWFVGQNPFKDDQFWQISVNYKTYKNALISSISLMTIFFLTYFFIWFGMAGKIYEYVAQHGEWLIFTFLFGSYGVCIVFFTLLSTLIVYFEKYYQNVLIVVLSMFEVPFTIIIPWLRKESTTGIICGFISSFIMIIVIIYELGSFKCENKKNWIVPLLVSLAQLLAFIACISHQVAYSGNFSLYGILFIVLMPMYFRPEICKKFKRDPVM